jgi:hypothetical protein
MRSVANARLIAAAAVITIVCILAYLPGLRGPFLLDDFASIHPLATMQAQGGSWWDVLTSAPHQIRGRWLTNLSFLVTNAATDHPSLPSAWAYKSGNLAIHLLCAAAVGMLAQALARAWNLTHPRSLFIAFGAGAVFATHPLLLSTVLYPVQRMAQVATLFTVLACLAYMRWRARLGSELPRHDHARLAAVVFFMLCAFLGKESGALAPLLILVVEICAFRWPRADWGARGRFEGGFGLVCAGPLILGSVTFALRSNEYLAGYAIRDFSLGERLLTQAHVVADYVGQLFWPRITEMGVYLDDTPVVRTLDASTLLLILSFLAAIAIAFFVRSRVPAVAFAILWFLAAHAMESTIIPLELKFEHRNYLAIAGPAILVAWLLSAIRRPVWALSASILVLGALSLQTARRAEQWGGFGQWIETEARNHPKSLRAGTDLMMYHLQQGDIAAASAARARLAASAPDSAQPALLKLGFACRGPLNVSALSEEDMRTLKTARIGKDAFHAFTGIQRFLGSGRGCAEPDWAAFAAVASAVSGNPDVSKSQPARLAWNRINARSQARIGNWRDSKQAIEEVLNEDPRDPRDWLTLMEANLGVGDTDGYARAKARYSSIGHGDPGLRNRVLELDARAARMRPLPDSDSK